MKIAIIGASGHWAYALDSLKNHTVVGVLRGFSGEDVSSVVDTLNKNGISAPVLAELNDIFRLEADIAIINTRFDLNAEYTIRCLEKDIYVFSEKPLALSEAELDKMEKIKTKAFVSAMFGISFEGWMETLREEIGKIGEIRMINARKSYKLGVRPDFYKDKRTFGGIVPWVSIHALHWVYSLTKMQFSHVKTVTSSLENKNNGDLETTAAGIYMLENGATVTVTADYYRPEAASTWDDDRIRIVGTRGILEYEKGKVFLIDENGEREIKIKPSLNVFELFLDRINGKDTGASMKESIYITRVALNSV
ncbi:MAG: Gfo/Idh/MocA family oxidoreductase [Clostridia bacterium]|nr:Gfo/Idh/MocA family oxidoreductase [Clostridia bacterium]